MAAENLSPTDPTEHSDHFYIALFHGRNSPTEELNDWGFRGPVIGPVGIGWTYGNLKIFEPGWDDFEFLPVTKDELVHYDGKYYGDFEVFHAADPKLPNAIREGGLHDWAKFKALAEPIVWRPVGDGMKDFQPDMRAAGRSCDDQSEMYTCVVCGRVMEEDEAVPVGDDGQHVCSPGCATRFLG